MKKYLQVFSLISADIQNGLYTSGDQLPTEMKLAEKYLVSRQRVRQALGLLEDKGIIARYAAVVPMFQTVHF